MINPRFRSLMELLSEVELVYQFMVFATPETAVGLFPDVGASYFLSRLPGFFGEYLGLTGARLDSAEMLACCLATHFVPSWLGTINKCFSHGTVEEILSSLEIEAAKKNEDWISVAIKSLKKASPIN
uniref:3-hydroxyisobutyryl-CoA hydrolase n=1 Tax=Opuntia streptacantha TaxID=393608 RepID=A0A7C8ZDF1_OPUST